MQLLNNKEDRIYYSSQTRIDINKDFNIEIIEDFLIMLLKKQRIIFMSNCVSILIYVFSFAICRSLAFNFVVVLIK